MTTQSTAAGNINLIKSAKSNVRCTTMYFGTLPDGRFVVTSRFQWEIRTTSRDKAESVFRNLCDGE